MVQGSLIDRIAKRNILIIDDDGLVSGTLCELLRRHGYFAQGSGDGFDALDKAEEENFDLIIADIKMPVIDGIETVIRIRESSRLKNKKEVPVIFITGYTDDEAVGRAKQIGEVIFKPFDTERFVSAIERHLV